MIETFKPSSLTIKELFGDVKALYKIPTYQRPYKWEDEQVDKLWQDMWEAYENEDKNYFLGSIITALPREKSSYHDVVDGQQRLTTLMILFCAFRNIHPDINSNGSDEDLDNVDITVLENSIFYNNKSERLKLFTHEQHRSDFESLIIHNKSGISLNKPYKKDIKNDEEPKYKFINTYLIFQEKIQKFSKEQAGDFLNFIFNQVILIRIDCSTREFAIKLFQVLNDRGMDLTSADLIKSYLLEKILKKYSGEEDVEMRDEKEKQFMADWRYCEQTIKDIEGTTLNDMFIIYEYMLLASNPKFSLVDELQTKFKESDANEIIADFKKLVDKYKNEIYFQENKLLYSFRYIRWNMYWRSILLTALMYEYSDFEKLCKALRRFYYLYWIAGKTLTQIKQTSFNIIKWVKENRTIEDIEIDLNKKLEEDKVISQALNALKEDIYQEPWCKPLLILIEYNNSDHSNPSFIELNQYLHAEHILPKEYAKFEEWKHITPVLSKQWLNSGGNLTLLSGAKNIEASNNPFETKISVYIGRGKYDDRDSKITAFKITQDIVKEYDKNTYQKQWNEKSIIDRYNWFCDEVGEILDFDTSSIKHIS
ncbi:DUF262 domain-containing protein [Flavobacterium sp.]|uniref:DUF262 domain-containing protein n=1 Tax=Flavobacterium sp. TaxID=239 RepID=UPI003752B730